MTPEESLRIVRGAMNAVHLANAQDGRRLVSRIRDIIETDAWREFLHIGLGHQVTYGPDEFAKFVAKEQVSGLGVDPDRLVAIIRAHRDDALADIVQDLLTPALGTVGRPSLENGCNTTILVDQRDARYVVGRLKRDDPNLAGQVRDGVISAHAAAIQAGIRHPYKSIRADNVDLATRSLVRIYGKSAIIEAIYRVNQP
ncbi:hypothetical protein UFOVP1183_27 [uncultured Caudovirales phage]|uniref:Uncharacterized protein n=1 Tax=uncultured Caudovirales phage TaxID=2100421 RepID=A0A6J5R412_9CAUD|nr:hypothetical protein UFOVP955_5 [uncultured Caudovirales phage]CAB4185305.1 hypothetical protein UFOVP1120_33 [uncultured Caudovirales phage]CAB4188358.1 hypothetical protein UFOVP1183_27 [uncultured Caudovirales phage]CAB4191039.1 hypothetical protein UFOVP1227_10 [uncultured Caudovirales phage]CAB5229977.1 hypothetical protein UFOVP1571_33 [uncultured Caudovirales phage]